MHGQQNIKTGI